MDIWIPLGADEFKTFKLRLIGVVTGRTVTSEEELVLLTYWNPKAGSNSKAHLQRVTDFIRYTNFTLDLV